MGAGIPPAMPCHPPAGGDTSLPSAATGLVPPWGFIPQARGMPWVGANSAALLLSHRAMTHSPAHTHTRRCRAPYPAQAHVVAALLQVQ